MKLEKIRVCSITALLVAVVLTSASCRTIENISPDEAREIAREAYVYGFPMVMNYKTMYAYVVDEESPEYKGPFNRVGCVARLFTPEDKAVVTPNADTPYCMFWVDLRSEPLVLTVPEMEPERFYHVQLIDLYTHNYAYVGTLTTGNKAGKYLLAGPDWEGEQFNAGSFEYIDFMLSLIRPVEEEKELMKRFAKIGLGTDEKFDIDRFSPEMKEALEAGVKEGFKEMETFLEERTGDPLASAKIFGTREFLEESAARNYGLPDFYALRAVAAHMGLYGNSGAEAIYPVFLVDGDGEPLNASGNDYSLTFDKGRLPPAEAFWSLTMYDGRTQLFIHNPLDRYLLSSTMINQFKREADGSIVFHIQKESPGEGKKSNWLPAPDGPFLYGVAIIWAAGRCA